MVDLRQLVVDTNLCSGCQLCEVICSAVKLGIFSPARARIQVRSFAVQGRSEIRVCRSCPEHPCVEACPFDAISPLETGGVRIDPDLCDACKACIEACPYEAIFFDEQLAKAISCDCCGGSPQCVAFCYPGALTWPPLDGP